ncbi:hypothetical protein Afil01_31470 [Actinorhabdospora filicis]|uniref:Uncharacterized protein n=1 Tax=Actinorhabdospora filicis TaxID=1785913 RepID=A0A9W6SJT2_9ACTN|nr:hypothetical protein [Actinorhabdospora filicis]GLZ78340.1 hypothetical protein Afil01_31470 [Actinorhabdospora filicis]
MALVRPGLGRTIGPGYGAALADLDARLPRLTEGERVLVEDILTAAEWVSARRGLLRAADNPGFVRARPAMLIA